MAGRWWLAKPSGNIGDLAGAMLDRTDNTQAPTGEPSPTGQPPREHAPAAWAAQLRQVDTQQRWLAREMERCQEQLSLLFEISTQMADRQEPDALETLLFRRLAALLRASVAFVDRAGCCRKFGLDGEVCGWDLPPGRVRAALGPHVETVRRARRVLAPPLTGDQAAALGGAHALVGALPRADVEPGVLILLRPANAPPFDDSDVLAADAVLSYGGQALGHILLVRHLQRSAVETVCTLVNAIDAKDNYTSRHSERVGSFAQMMGEALRLPRAQLQTLEWAGLLHDVGKIGIPEQILSKTGKLTPAEFELMKTHTRIGYEVLKPVARFEPVLDAVLYHHENHDGSGYPEGLRGDQVPLEARIIHLVDIFDAVTTARPYRAAFSYEDALQLLRTGSGTVTDPELTQLFLDLLNRCRQDEPLAFQTRFGHLFETPAASVDGPPVVHGGRV
ncbi:MAG: HD-GYP domain-containing protein [Phycisphaerales bacterium]|nr:HD-GYP domain-containing protein [Phycisphaerales bacterium]